MGALKSVLSNRGLGIKEKKCLHEVVIVPTALYGAEAWAMRSAERRKVNVLEMKCLRSLVGVSRMDRVRNVEVRRRTGMKMELASRADQRVLRWYLRMWKEWVITVWPRRVLIFRSQWGTSTRETEVRLDGWRKGSLRQQRNDGGGCATMRERPERVESPGTYACNWMSFTRLFLLGQVFLSDRPPMLWWLTHGEGDAVT